MKRLTTLLAVPLIMISFSANGQYAKPRTKAPMSKAEYTQIVREVQQAEARAEREAVQKYHNSKRSLSQQHRLQMRLEETYYAQVTRRHKITHYHLIEIMAQSLKSDPRRK